MGLALNAQLSSSPVLEQWLACSAAPACTKLYNIACGFGGRASRGAGSNVGRPACSVPKLVEIVLEVQGRGVSVHAQCRATLVESDTEIATYKLLDGE